MENWSALWDAAVEYSYYSDPPPPNKPALPAQSAETLTLVRALSKSSPEMEDWDAVLEYRELHVCERDNAELNKLWRSCRHWNEVQAGMNWAELWSLGTSRRIRHLHAEAPEQPISAVAEADIANLRNTQFQAFPMVTWRRMCVDGYCRWKLGGCDSVWQDYKEFCQDNDWDPGAEIIFDMFKRWSTPPLPATPPPATPPSILPSDDDEEEEEDDDDGDDDDHDGDKEEEDDSDEDEAEEEKTTTEAETTTVPWTASFSTFTPVSSRSRATVWRVDSLLRR